MLPFAIKIFSAFLSQKFQSRDFAKMIYQFFYIYSTVTTCKKSKNVMQGFVIKLKKFILGHFLSKKLPMQTFSKKFFTSILSLYAALASCENQKSSKH